MDTNETSSNIIRWLYTAKPQPGTEWSDFNQARLLLEPADIIVVDGNTPADKRIKSISGSHWSQVYLYIGRLHDVRNPSLRAIIESEFDCQSDTQLMLKADLIKGVHLVSVSDIRQKLFRVCRPRGLNSDDVQNVISYGLSRINRSKRHAWWPAIRLLLVPWGLLPKRWRKPLFKYISGRRLRRAVGGTVGDAFSFIQFPILPLFKSEDGNPSTLYRQYPLVFYPSDFELSPYFDIIKYPFIATENSNNRLLAWNGYLKALHGNETDKETQNTSSSDNKVHHIL